jgi:hypothetical protein
MRYSTFSFNDHHPPKKHVYEDGSRIAATV